MFARASEYETNGVDSLSGTTASPGLLLRLDGGRDDRVAARVQQLGDVRAEVGGLGVPASATAFAGRRRRPDARVDGRFAPFPRRRDRVGPAERQRFGDVGQRFAPSDALRPAATTGAASIASTASAVAASATAATATTTAASAAAAHPGAAPFAQYVGELRQRAAPPPAAHRRRRLRCLRGRRLRGDLSGRVPASAQPLFERRLLHLLAQDVVPAVSALPHQAYLVAEDGQVAHETDGRHRPRDGGK